ncbi:MAG: 3-hydroxyacyl-CoA dehydrogenase NAD-binding domain-containing protein [Legionellaceae bacterium]|nr:3-hydroxyacyl-CoA dehydrogenase NAD-binding domain-containing protein [Legionellaceae bacterium]
MRDKKNWVLTEDAEHIVWLGFDRAGMGTNTISEEVLDELNTCLQDIATMGHVKGLVIHSLKEKGFVAGADVKTFSSLDTAERAADFLHKGQAVFSRLEALKIPTVAMIDGFCLGGGMELALACDYRIATDSDDTRLGLPEILLGIHPGWGGVVRLPRLMGGFKALSQVILTGAMLRPKKAKKLGMVDDVVPLRQLKRAAVYFIKNKPAKRTPSFIDSLDKYAPIRFLVAKILRHEVGKKARKAHYPAPFSVIDFWEKESGFDERAYRKEADSVVKLVTEGDTAKNLIRLFLLRERMKAFAKTSSFQAKHVHVIGAGVMGGDIAAWCAKQGLKVTLQDQSYAQIAPAMGRAHTLFKKTLKKPRLIEAAQDRLIPDPEGHGLKRADVIIEAVFENLEVKQDIFKRAEALAKPDAILATNTSSIPLDEISTVMKKPGRLVGIHFFNPVSRMELVEIVSADKTLSRVKEDAAAFVNQISRLPLPVKSSPGFLVNRVLMPYLLECIQLLEDGYAPEVIDEAAKAFGMMMGPVELADTVGLDVCLAVAENLTAHYGGSVPERIRDMVKAKRLGRKSGEGFYQYKQGKPVKNKAVLKQASVTHDEEIARRLILRMVNEAAACLREEVVADADLLDAGMIFGTGFAPFRGGPMHYAKAFGQDKLNASFRALETQYGGRFKADTSIGRGASSK